MDVDGVGAGSGHGVWSMRSVRESGRRAGGDGRVGGGGGGGGLGFAVVVRAEWNPATHVRAARGEATLVGFAPRRVHVTSLDHGRFTNTTDDCMTEKKRRAVIKIYVVYLLS